MMKITQQLGTLLRLAMETRPLKTKRFRLVEIAEEAVLFNFKLCIHLLRNQ